MTKIYKERTNAGTCFIAIDFDEEVAYVYHCETEADEALSASDIEDISSWENSRDNDWADYDAIVAEIEAADRAGNLLDECIYE